MAGGQQTPAGPGTQAPAAPTPSTTATITPPSTPVNPAPSPLGGSALDPPATPDPTQNANIIGDITTASDPFNPESLAIPDGFDRGENFEHFAAVMKEFGVSQTKAQELVKYHAEAMEAALKKPVEDWQKQQGDWQREIMADPELGGSKFDGVKQTLAKVLDDSKLTDPGFREAMGFTGAGNHPAIVRTLFRWANALSEGAEVQGGVPGRRGNGELVAERPSAAQALYGPDGPHTGGPKI